MRWLQRIGAVTAVGGAVVLTIGIACYAAGMRINTTKSIPIGLYWTSSQPIEKGAYVMFCPPQASVFNEAKERGYIGAGFCPGNYGYLMKRVLAVEGDTVTLTEDGVRVNNRLLPHSVLIPNDKAGRPLPRYQPTRFTMSYPDVLLMSDVSDTSFDGRYFGPINRSQIWSVIRPVLTW